MAALEKLFQDDEKDDENITINKEFASKYQKFKECQELDRLKNDEKSSHQWGLSFKAPLGVYKVKQKYGDVLEDSESESEDEDAEALTPQIEQDFLKTLSMIKCKDPKIYKKETVFFDDRTDNGNLKQAKQKEKNTPMLLKDYERERLLKKGEKAYLSDSDDDDGNKHFIEKKKTEELTYNEEQEQLKKSFKDAVESESDDEELLKVREKSSDEIKKENKEYQSWLKTAGKKLGALERYWNNDQLDENEKFLRDYILKKQYIDNEDKIPTYKEVVGASDEEEEEDDDEVEREEEFERKFNFRFEEPDQEFVKRYPRTIAESVRRTDDKRKEHRKERVERKKKEKDQKKEELKRLKKLKRKEIMEKIEKLKEITGNSKVGFLEEDMDGDFDASKYDELMTQVFDDDYYDEEETEKPTFSDEDEYIDENWDEWSVPPENNYLNSNEDNEEHLPHCEEPDFNMDADYVPGNSKSLKQKKTSKFAQAIQRKKPIFDPDEKSFQEYFDEYYKLDFEDIIDDMPVRFKYRSCMPNDYGLSTDEVLNADDKELNEWCSLKKTMRYYNEEEEKKERQRYKKKSRDKKKKQRVFQSLQQQQQNDEEEATGVNETRIEKPRNIKSLQRKKEKLRELDSSSKTSFKRRVLTSKFSTKKLAQSSVRNSKMKKLEKQFRGSNPDNLRKFSLQRLAAYGLDKRKKK